MLPTSIYLHIPFCSHRCGYCDFNTYAGVEELIPQYVDALCEEIQFLSSSLVNSPIVHTIFFGGGTPSLLSIEQLDQILSKLHTTWGVLPGVEITLEANPRSLSKSYLRELRSLNINRLSIGMQSANPDELYKLERNHNHYEVINSIIWARQVAFNNLNLDLIYGLPEQTLDQWKFNLEQAILLNPEHLSLYSLTIEHGTPFGNWTKRGLMVIPDPDLAADMYEWSFERLEKENYIQYEISNWARPFTQGLTADQAGIKCCVHNLQYWRNLPYLGLGAAAHGYFDGYRLANVLSPKAYIERLLSNTSSQLEENCFTVATSSSAITPATQSVIKTDKVSEIAETMMMGLRLVNEGVSNEIFFNRFGIELNDVFREPITRLILSGLVEWASDNPENLRLTRKGRLLGNVVFREFLEPKLSD